MQREPIEIAAMNLARDLLPLRVTEGASLEEYWDHVLSPASREVYRRAARNAHAALTDQDAVKNAHAWLAELDRRAANGNKSFGEIIHSFGAPGGMVGLLVADLRALITRPIESEEEARNAEAARDFYSLGES